MPFNFQTFKQRTLTSIVFVLVMLCGLLINHWTFFILFSIIHFGCWIEYQKLIGLIDADYRTVSSLHRNIIMLLGWSFMLFMTNNAYRIGNISLHGIGWYGSMLFTIIFCLNEIVLKKILNIKVISYSLFGLVYISLCWGLMMGLQNTSSLFPFNFTLANPGFVIPVVLIASIWINDTMQYLVGSFIGKTPFSKISPKKTWEGTIGGSILCIVVVSLVGNKFLGLSWQLVIGISSIAAIMGTLGDLFESKLKRLANVKDSGNIMPGHGGFLDRFDSLLIATPFVWLYFYFFIY